MNERKNWFIYAYPATYGGLHGMYNYEIAFNMSYEEACNWGSELAYETVESYLRADEIYSTEDFMEEFYDGAEWDEQYRDEYWDSFEEVMQDECAFEVWPLKDGVTEADYYKWQKENQEPHDFIQRYCCQ